MEHHLNILFHYLSLDEVLEVQKVHKEIYTSRNNLSFTQKICKTLQFHSFYFTVWRL